MTYASSRDGTASRLRLSDMDVQFSYSAFEQDEIDCQHRSIPVAAEWRDA